MYKYLHKGDNDDDDDDDDDDGNNNMWLKDVSVRSRWPRRLSHRSAVTRLLRFWVRIPPVA